MSTAVLVVYWYWLGLCWIGVGLYAAYPIRLRRSRDEHRGADEAYADELARVKVELSGEPEVEWEARRAGFALYVAGWELRSRGGVGTPDGRHHYRRDVHAAHSYDLPRHAAEDRYDPGRLALMLRAPTQEFETIAAEAGFPVAVHGPREADLWVQAELLEVAT